MEKLKALIIHIVALSFGLAVMIMIFYSAAGTTNIPGSRAFFLVAFTYFISNSIILYRYNPNLLIQRLKTNQKESINQLNAERAPFDSVEYILYVNSDLGGTLHDDVFYFFITSSPVHN